MTCNIKSNNIVFSVRQHLAQFWKKLHETAYDTCTKPLFFNNYLTKQKSSFEPKNDILFNCRSGKFLDVP